MQQVTPTYNFTTEQQNGVTTFTYQKKRVRRIIFFPLAIYSAIPSLFIAAAISSLASQNGAPLGVFVWLLLEIAIPFTIIRLTNRNRKTGVIAVGNGNIIADGKTYQLDHVSSFLIKTRSGDNTNETVYVSSGGYYPPTLAGGVHAISNSMSGVSKSLGDALKRQLDAAGFQIAIRYGTKEIIIAKHLGEYEAEALFDKITASAGYTKTA